MFIGHYALGLAAKRAAPRTSLGALIAAPTLADLLWPLFLLLGWEHVSVTPSPDPFLNLTFDAYPISHSPPCPHRLGFRVRRPLRPAYPLSRGRRGDFPARRESLGAGFRGPPAGSPNPPGGATLWPRVVDIRGGHRG